MIEPTEELQERLTLTLSAYKSLFERHEALQHINAHLIDTMKWIPVGQELPLLDADNCCMDEADYGRYSNAVNVFDEDEGEVFRAIYDGHRDGWFDASDGGKLDGVTHWRPLPAPPKAEGGGE